MIYLDDLAVEVKTQKGRAVRGVACGILLCIAFIIGFKETSAINSLAEQEAQKNQQLTELEFAKTTLEDEIAEMNAVKGFPFTPSDSGSVIANLQTNYGGKDIQGDKTWLAQQQADTEDALSDYIAAGQIKSSWFPNDFVKYQWTCLNNQTYIVLTQSTVPCLFDCRLVSNPEVVESVVIGDYDVSIVKNDNGDDDLDVSKLDNIRIYETADGVIAEGREAVPSYFRTMSDTEFWQTCHIADKLDGTYDEKLRSGVYDSPDAASTEVSDGNSNEASNSDKLDSIIENSNEDASNSDSSTNDDDKSDDKSDKKSDDDDNALNSAVKDLTGGGSD